MKKNISSPDQGIDLQSRYQTVLRSLFTAFLLFCSMGVFGQSPVPMSSQPGLSYTENFSDITNWTDNFSAGIGANRWKSYPITAGGTANDGKRTTKSSAAFVSSTSGGAQKGTGNLVFLSTGSGTSSEAVAVDLLLNFTGVNAGVLSFDWAAVDNVSGTRPTSLRIFWSTDNSTFTEITAAQIIDVISPTTGSITTVALPSAFNNSATARLRFYNHAGTVTGSSNRDKIAIDNVTVNATAAVTTYSLTYDGNTNTGGTAPTDSGSPYASGASVTVLGNTGTLAKTNYNFRGWNTLADGSGTDRAAASTFIISANTTLYAKWTGNVTYNANGGTGTTSDATDYAPGASVTTGANGFTYTGFTFVGWNTQANGLGTDYTASQANAFNFSGNVTLYAKWTSNSTITYANFQFDTSKTINEGQTYTVFGRVFAAGITEGTGQGAGISAWVGYSSTSTNPSVGTWTWVPLTYFGDDGPNNDEYSGLLGVGITPGTYNVVTRFQIGSGSYVYGGKNNAIWASAADNGSLIVNSNVAQSGQVSPPSGGPITVGSPFITYVQFFKSFFTEAAGQGTPVPTVEFGYNVNNNDAVSGTGWTWLPASFDIQVGNNDQYKLDIGTALAAGTYYYAARIKMQGSTEYKYFGTGSFAYWNNDNGTFAVNPNVVDGGAVSINPTSVSEGNGSTASVQIYEPGETNPAGQAAGITVEVAYSTTDINPTSFTGWASATYAGDIGNNDNYTYNIPNNLMPGTYYVAARAIKSGSTVYQYFGTLFNIWNNNSAVLTVTSNLPDFANIQLPKHDQTITQGTGFDVYAQVRIAGVTDVLPDNPGGGVTAWIGYSTTKPTTNASFTTGWTWVPAVYNPNYASSGTYNSNNDEYYVQNFGQSVGYTFTNSGGPYYFVSRFQKTGSSEYVYGGSDDTDNNISGGIWNGTTYTERKITVQTPQEINIQKSGTDIPTTGTYSFGNQISGTSGTPVTFTVENKGQANLLLTGTPKIIISGTNAAEFIVNEAATMSPVTGNTSTTFTVTFSPTTSGAKTAQLSIANNDTSGNENPYLINLTGTGNPTNDLCVDAISLVVNDPDVNSTLANATSSASPFSGTSKDVWYRFTPSCDGKFTIDLTGTAGRVNIWLYNACGTTSSLYNTATNGNVKSLTAGTTAAPLLNGTTYYVRIVADDAAGEASFKIKVNNLIAIVTQPVDATVNAGTTAQFSVSSPANQTGRQWQVLTTVGGAVWTDIPSATGSPYTTPSTTIAMNGYKYRVIISNGTCQTITSAEALLTVKPVTISTDMFRSKVSGDWDVVGTWISSSDGGTTWLNPATAKPTTSATSIEIMDTHTVKTWGSEGAKDLTVHSGGTLDLNTTFTNSGLFKVKDNGTVNIKYTSANLSTNIWAGTEAFEANSNFIVNSANKDNLFFVANAISSNPSTGTLFGNLTLQPTGFNATGNWTGIFPDGTYNLTSNDFTINNSTTRNFTLGGEALTVGRDFIVNLSGTGDVAADTGSIQITISRDFIKNGSGTGRFRTNGGGTGIYNVNGDLKVNAGTFSNNGSTAAATTSTINLKGNLFVASGAVLTSNNTNSTYVANNVFNFSGLAIQNINIVDQLINYSTINIKNDSYVKIINQNLSLANASNITVENGGTLDFGFNGTTALNLLTGTGNGQKFELKDGGTLKITSPDGITTFGNYTGNVQVGATSAANRVFGIAGIYHYIGKENQVSGNGLPSTAGDKKVIVELANDDLKFWATPDSGVGSVKRFTSGGGLEIRKGIVLDGQNPDVSTENYGRFADAVDTSATAAESGNLTMTGGRYILYHGAQAVPHLSGTYDLTGGIIQFDGNNQSIRAPKIYLNVEVTGKNVGTPGGNITLKSISTPAIIEGSLSVKNGGEFLINSNSIVGESGDQTVAVESGGIFRTGDADGFSGTNQTSIQPSIENINLQDGSTVEYSRAGAQTITDFKPLAADDSNLATGGYYNLKISGDNGNLETGTAKTISATTPIYVRNQIDVAASARLIIDADKAIIVRNAVNNNSGAATGLIVESDGNLKQLENVTNTTAISVRRLLTLSGVGRKEYNFFSSPVADQNMKLIYGGVPANVRYVTVLNEATNLFVNAITADWAIKARGFAVTEPKTSYLDIPTQSLLNTEVEYKGIPNNGNTISINLRQTSTSKGYNVVGNPYPSNIDIVKLWKNSVTDWQNNPTPEISADFRFWDNKANSTYVQMGGTYQGYSYAIFNAKSQSSTAAPGLDPNNGGSSSGVKPPSNIIKVSQAFMIRALQDNVPLKFNNEMREVVQGTPYYGKEASINRYRLQLRTSGDFVLQNAITYIPVGSASFGVEDTRIPNSQASDALFSYAGDAKVVINGRNTFNTSDVISLGVRHFEMGTYKIEAVDMEGVFANGQSIYLKDKQLNILTDLTAGSYTFTSNSGEFTNRFEIVYEPGAVLTTESSTRSSFEVYRDANDFVVRTSDEIITKVEVYDAAGRMVMTIPGTTKKVRIDSNRLVEGLYIIKANLRNGEMYTKKIRK